MNRPGVKYMCAFLMAILAAVSVSGTAARKEKEPETRPTRVLVAYVSAPDMTSDAEGVSYGPTGRVARVIAAKTGGDLFALTSDQTYPGDYTKCRAYMRGEFDRKKMPRLSEDIDIDGYDVIFLGYPVWWEQMPRILHTFMERHEWDGKTIIPFVLHGDSNASGVEVLSQMVDEEESTVRRALNMPGRVAVNDSVTTDNDVSAWLDRLKIPARVPVKYIPKWLRNRK